MEIDLQNNIIDKTMSHEEQEKPVSDQQKNYITFKDLEQVRLQSQKDNFILTHVILFRN